jgi:hypothetical protein
VVDAGAGAGDPWVLTASLSMSGAVRDRLPKVTLFAPARRAALIRTVPGRPEPRVAGKSTAVGTVPFTLTSAVRRTSLTYVTLSVVIPATSAVTPVNPSTPARPTPVTRAPPEQRSQSSTRAPPRSTFPAASAS